MRVSHTLLPRLLAITAAVALCSSMLVAQQTLGGFSGEITDPSGSVIPNATVTLVDEQTSYTRSAKTNGEGIYVFVNLPIDSYTVTFAADGFDTQTNSAHCGSRQSHSVPECVQLKVAAAASATVEAWMPTPLLNATDTTNGYVMDKAQIETVPLPTGSFTGLLASPIGQA